MAGRDWRRRWLLVAAAVVCGLVATAGAVGLAATSREVVVHPNLLVNPPSVIDANNSPAVVRNPTDPHNVVVVHRVDRPGFGAALRWSADGGKVWRSTALPLPAGKDRPYAPDAAFAPDGTLYIVYANLTGRGNAPENLWLVRSDDGGRSVSDPVRVAGSLSFQARVTAAPDGTVHVTYLRVDNVGLLQIVGAAEVVAVRSDDGGRTFSDPVAVSDPHRPRVGAATPVADGRGGLVVVYVDFKGDVRDFSNLPGPPWPEPFALVAARSTDGGRSFTEGVEIDTDLLPTRRFLVFLPEFPTVAAGPDHSLVAAWSDGRNGDEDVFLTRSDDGGASWTPAVRVNDNPVGDGTTQSLPAVDVADNARVDVLFYDRRADPDDVMTEVFLASSADGGRSWRNVRVSSASFDSRIGPSAAPHLPPDLGSRLGVASAPRTALAVWTDTRLGSEASGRQDIASAAVDVPDPGHGTSAWALLGASMLGGVATLVGWRRTSRPPEAGDIPQGPSPPPAR